MKTFRMVNPEGGALPFSFLPGQFLTFSVEIDGKRARRSYTIASSPATTAYVEVTVKRQEHQGVSAFLHDRGRSEVSWMCPPRPGASPSRAKKSASC